MRSYEQQLSRAVRAGCRALVVATPDEARALDLLEDVGERLVWPVHTFSSAEGIDKDRDTHPLPELLARLARSGADELWVLFDALAELTDPNTRRLARVIAQRTDGPAVVFVGPEATIGQRPARRDIPELWVLELPPPSREELHVALDDVASVLERAGYEGATRALAMAADAIVTSAIGLERASMDRLLAEAVLEHGLDVEAIRRFIAQHKPSVLDPAGHLTEARPASVDELGGLHGYKHWLARRRLALSAEAAAAGVAPPRGVLLLGVQGCGKSLAARATAGILDLPLVRLDVGALFGGTVGQSEANLRRATLALERIAPVVAWIDEIDKALAGTEGAASDAGTAARVLGGLLTWLAERSRPVFIVATANGVEHLPPELLRRGRLDEVFFIDLPGPEEREQILQVHLELRPAQTLGAAPPTADPWEAFAELARNAEGFSGAELEGALTEARLDALADHRSLAAADLERALAATVPLAVSRAEDVEALRQWARQRARPAQP